MAVTRSRDELVKCRTQLVNHIRAMVKQAGARLPRSSTDAFPQKVAPELPDELRPALEPLLETVAALTREIHQYDEQIEALCAKYPATQVLQQITGVGALTALTYVLTLEDPRRFAKSRTVGSFLGLTPRRSQSGDSDPELRITKAGDGTLRRLLISAAHYILGHRGPDCDLRRYGERILARGGAGARAKKRAVVAVARKLAVLLHSLWKTGEVYDPLSAARRNEAE